MVGLVAVTPFTVALTVALPWLTPVMTPLVLIVRTLGLLLTQFVVMLDAFKIFVPVAARVTLTVPCAVPVTTMFVALVTNVAVVGV